VKTDPKHDQGTPAGHAGSRPTPADLPPLRRVTVADVQKVEALLRVKRTART
jgi:hypothetical protein